jgi:hypothetical protein
MIHPSEMGHPGGATVVRARPSHGRQKGVMGTFLTVNGSVFICWPCRLVFLVSLASMLQLSVNIRQYFILARRRRLNLFSEEPHHSGYMSRRIERWNGWT